MPQGISQGLWDIKSIDYPIKSKLDPSAIMHDPPPHQHTINVHMHHTRSGTSSNVKMYFHLLRQHECVLDRGSFTAGVSKAYWWWYFSCLPITTDRADDYLYTLSSTQPVLLSLYSRLLLCEGDTFFSPNFNPFCLSALKSSHSEW